MKMTEDYIMATMSWLDLSDEDWDSIPLTVQEKLVLAFIENYPE